MSPILWISFDIPTSKTNQFMYLICVTQANSPNLGGISSLSYVCLITFVFMEQYTN